jgi:hydrogenase maturation factor HypF (carbamoyltransferase family)
MVEILICDKCKCEYELYYDDNNTVVSSTKCKCSRKIKKINSLKILDYALKKIGRFKNEKSRKRFN